MFLQEESKLGQFWVRIATALTSGNGHSMASVQAAPAPREDLEDLHAALLEAHSQQCTS